mmetsp:Transcript_25775/g.52758  ORF Transcript_25775/g.52758 Transcript_25775/m.52758 type:complete len:407 (+) Transcript_25775:1078-2298(+)
MRIGPLPVQLGWVISNALHLHVFNGLCQTIPVSNLGIIGVIVGIIIVFDSRREPDAAEAVVSHSTMISGAIRSRRRFRGGGPPAGSAASGPDLGLPALRRGVLLAVTLLPAVVAVALLPATAAAAAAAVIELAELIVIVAPLLVVTAKRQPRELGQSHTLAHNAPPADDAAPFNLGALAYDHVIAEDGAVDRGALLDGDAAPEVGILDGGVGVDATVVADDGALHHAPLPDPTAAPHHPRTFHYARPSDPRPPRHPLPVQAPPPHLVPLPPFVPRGGIVRNHRIAPPPQQVAADGVITPKVRNPRRVFAPPQHRSVDAILQSRLLLGAGEVNELPSDVAVIEFVREAGEDVGTANVNPGIEEVGTETDLTVLVEEGGGDVDGAVVGVVVVEEDADSEGVGGVEADD